MVYKNIFYLVTFKKKSGGSLYGRYISNIKEVKTHYLLNSQSKNKIVKLVVYFIKLFKFHLFKKSRDIIIYNQDNCFFLQNQDKNILLTHHYHPVSKNILIRYYQIFLHKNILKNKDKIDLLVVVSEFWKHYYSNLGFANIKVIYNPFEMSLYKQRTFDEKVAFKKKYNLENKPIVYLGNPQREKGTDKAYNALKNLDVHLVTTGIKTLDLPVKHLELSFEEYILLLQVADVSVLMSQIKEGWNRVAHESLLCKTPVVGTGFGGMGELLIKSQQTICQDFTELAEKVSEILMRKQKVTDEALAYVYSFTQEKFENSWKEVLEI